MKLSSIAVIPDGNRRYAMKNKLGIDRAYARGFQKVEDLLGWTDGSGIDKVSFWALSLENFTKRSKLELRILFKLMKMKINDSLRNGHFKEKGIRIKFFGKLDLLPQSLVEKMHELETATQDGARQLFIAVAYSGRDEILHAAKAVAIEARKRKTKVEDITEKDFESKLYSPASPDLIIRTGDVSRLSGFLPWQNTYSELYFSKKLWPEFEKRDFQRAVGFYNAAQRRFGK